MAGMRASNAQKMLGASMIRAAVPMPPARAPVTAARKVLAPQQLLHPIVTPTIAQHSPQSVAPNLHTVAAAPVLKKTTQSNILVKNIRTAAPMANMAKKIQPKFAAPSKPVAAKKPQPAAAEITETPPQVSAVLPASVIAEAYARASRLASASKKPARHVQRVVTERVVSSHKQALDNTALEHTSHSLSRLAQALESPSFHPSKSTLENIANQLAVVSSSLAKGAQ